MGENAAIDDFFEMCDASAPHPKNKRIAIVINFIDVAVNEEQDTDGVDKGR